MSAIVGIYNLHGRSVGQENLEQMVTLLAHRGPDGAGVWHEGPVGLGHRLLWTTPESVQERLPFVSGDLVITADTRIDNRTELLAILGLTDRPSREITDSQLILAAYEKWGEDCPEQLLGDFAFAIWDKRQQTLFCARDHFGVKPFYYYFQPGRVFVFASEIKALFCVPEVPHQLNEVRVADYLVPMMEDKAITFYQDILRLPPAQSMTVSRDGIRLRSYWSLNPAYELQLSSDEEYASAFLELFTEAVQCRLRSVLPVGSHLSGGLDSSAVTCVVKRLHAQETNSQLHTFSNIFNDVPQCDERPFINAVLAQNGYIPHYIHADQVGPLTDLDRVFWHQDEPFWGPNHFLPWGLNKATKQTGVRVVLDGFDGDTTVSHGVVYFAELARKGQWETFSAEARAVAQHFPVSPLNLLHQYGLPYLEELARGWKWIAFTTAANQLNACFQVSRQNLFLQHGLKPLVPESLQKTWQTLRGHDTAGDGIDPIINPDFARHIGLGERLRTFDTAQMSPPLTVREDHWRSLTSGLFPLVLELSDRCAAAFSIEARHPFMDRRLIEFCLALPPEQKLHQGWSRIVMRRAMADVLPEQVQWRGGKTDMNPNFVRGLLTFDREILDEIISRHSQRIARYVETNILREVYTRLISQGKVQIDDVMTVWKVATLASWLQYSDL